MSAKQMVSAIDIAQTLVTELNLPPEWATSGVRADIGLDGLGLDAYARIALIRYCESRYGVSFSGDWLSKSRLTLLSLADAIASGTADKT